MRTQIDRLSKDLLTTDALKKIKEMDAITVGQFKGMTGQQAFDDIKQTLTKNLNSYMRRRYKAFEKASYLPDEATKALAVTGYKRNRKFLLKQYCLFCYCFCHV